MEEKDKDNIAYVLKLLKYPELLLTKECHEWLKDNSELYWDMRAAYDSLSLEEKQIPDVKEQWERLQQAIDHRGKQEHFGRKTKILTPLYKWSIAAVFACLLAGAGLYFYLKPAYPIKYMQALSNPQEIVLNNSKGKNIVLQDKNDTIYRRSNFSKKIAYNTISTPRGKTFNITLSDGSKVMLNAESSLRYPTSFQGKNRTVELNGEAFFTVAKDKRHPFIVHTSQATTVVTGTKFNFRAYKDAAPHVTLLEGCVFVNNTKGNQSVKLNPGDDASLSNVGELQVQQIDVERYIAWTEGFFYFETTPLSEIMSELGRWYNVNIYFSDQDIMNYHFNFWVNKNQSLTKALDMLNQLGKVNATLKNNTIYIN
jgi:hypothetical protein